jgi:hypothetical protein
MLTSENSVLRNVPRSKLKEATRERRKVRNEKLKKFLLLNKYYSGDQLRVEETGGACGMHGGEETAYEFLVEKKGMREATWRTWILVAG